MKRQHIRVGGGCDRQFACFAEPSRRSAQMKSAEADVEFDPFGPGGPHEQFTGKAVEFVRVVLKSEFVIAGEDWRASVIQKAEAGDGFQSLRQFRDAQPSLQIPVVEPLKLREKNRRLQLRERIGVIPAIAIN